MPDLLLASCRQAPPCPVPERVAVTHWASHLPFAYWLADVLKPQLFVELGTYTGVSFCAFCQAFLASGQCCEAYAVDLWTGDAHMGAYDEAIYADLVQHVRQYYGHFAQLLRISFDDALTQFLPGTVDLLHLDGGHSRDAILHDFYNWLPKMSSRGVILIHDISTRYAGFGGVDAWEEISRRFASFSFCHGYGLGLVSVGTQVPAAMKTLCNLDAESRKAFASTFQIQGRIYERLVSQEELRLKEQAIAAHALQDIKGQMERLRQIVQQEREDYQQREAAYVAQKEQECEFLRHALHEAERRCNAYETSLSWKLTSPLRRLAAYIRNSP